mgnify:CR=1 FL=1
MEIRKRWKGKNSITQHWVENTYAHAHAPAHTHTHTHTMPMPIPNSNLLDEAFGLRCCCDASSGCDDSLAAPVNTKNKKKKKDN